MLSLSGLQRCAGGGGREGRALRALVGRLLVLGGGMFTSIDSSALHVHRHTQAPPPSPNPTQPNLEPQPGFFSERRPLFAVDPADGSLRNTGGVGWGCRGLIGYCRHLFVV